MWRALLRPAPLRAVWALLTRPLVALVVANGVLLLHHWPEVVSLSVRSELAHFSLHALLLGSAIVMWWPVLSPLPELPAPVATGSAPVPLLPVPRADDPGVVPDVRDGAALSDLRHVPSDLGHRTRSPIS